MYFGVFKGVKLIKKFHILVLTTGITMYISNRNMYHKIYDDLLPLWVKEMKNYEQIEKINE